jgi:hypothetical protein
VEGEREEFNPEEFPLIETDREKNPPSLPLPSPPPSIQLGIQYSRAIHWAPIRRKFLTGPLTPQYEH